MSDLAPFVAAALRDKVVADLQKENERLEQELSAYRRIQIVNSDTTIEQEYRRFLTKVVVYSEGQLEQGKLKEEGNLLEVELNVIQPCHISRLWEARVMVGGYHKNFIGRKDYLAILYPNEEGDSDTCKIVSLCGSHSWITFAVHGWPKADWSVIMRAVRDRSMPQKEVLNYILNELPGAYPEATVSFQSVSLYSHESPLAIALPPLVLPRLREGLDEEQVNVYFEDYIRRKYRQIADIDDEVLEWSSCARIRKHLVTNLDIHDAESKETRAEIRRVVKRHLDRKAGWQSYSEGMDHLFVI